MVNVAATVWSNAERDPHRMAVRSGRGDLTYGELREASARVGGAVSAAGLQPGDRVVLIAPSIVEFPVVYLGLHAVGVSVITMNTMATAAEIGVMVAPWDQRLWDAAETVAHATGGRGARDELRRRAGRAMEGLD